MAWDAGTITNAAPWASLSTKLKTLVGGTGVENWSFVENVPAGTGAGQSGSASYSLDVFRCRGAAVLPTRMAQINLGNTGSSTDATSYVFTITTPATSKFLTVFIFNMKGSAADDPTSVTLDGSNAPTFTKIKSQASGGGSTTVKTTLWIAKTGGSAPTGTQLTISFGGVTQLGCGIIVDQWDGMDLTLAATGVDSSGTTQIGIQVVGNNGTTQTAHSATLATMLNNKSIAVTWAACATGTGTQYTTEAGWNPTAGANSVVTAPPTQARGMFRPYQEDLTGVLTNIGTITEWAVISFEFGRTAAATTVTSPNDSGIDWYFVIEIPATDGAVNSSFNCAEDYDLNKSFNRMPPAPTSTAPVSSGGWRSDTFAAYASYTGNNRSSTVHQTLNTSGFNYWIKLTKNAVTISTRVGSSEMMNGAMLLDSFITIGTDLPLVNVSGSTATGNSMSRVMGVSSTISPGTGWECETYPWTTPTRQGIGTNAAASQDLWMGQKIHVARIFVGHSAGNTTANASLYGYAKGLWKTDFLCFTRGGTVQLGDTMTISGNTWTVINNSSIVLGTGQALILLTRAT